MKQDTLLNPTNSTHKCGECGWPVIICLSNFTGNVESDRSEEAEEHDTFSYCSNIKCGYHEGQGTNDLQDMPDWILPE